MQKNPAEKVERCCICGQTLGGAGPQKGLCDHCMQKFRDDGVPPPGTRCPLCGERRRRNLVRHAISGEFVCYCCRDALSCLPPDRQDIQGLRGVFTRRFGGS